MVRIRPSWVAAAVFTFALSEENPAARASAAQRSNEHSSVLVFEKLDVDRDPRDCEKVV